MQAIQEQLRPCKHCQKQTLQRRNVQRTGLLGFLVHALLVLFTGGLWLIVVALVLMGQVTFGGWKCSVCQ